MVLGSDVVNDIIMDIFPTEIAFGIVIVGFGIFFLYFFGTDEWKGFSDLEKIIYSIITGWLLWFFVIYPISMGYETFNLLFKDTNDIDIFIKTIGNFKFYAFVIFVCFFVGRICSDSPLSKKKEFVNLTSRIIITTIPILFSLLILLLVSFYFTSFKYPIESLINRFLATIYLFIILYFIFSKVSGNLNLEFPLKKYLVENVDSNKKIIRLLVGLFVLFIVIACFVGYFFYDPQVVDKKFEITRLEIPVVQINNNSNVNLSGSLFIENEIEVNFGLVKWVYIPRNFTILEAYNTDNNSIKYSFSENEVIIKGNGKLNITLNGTKETKVNINLYNITEENLNEDFQRFFISFNNPYKYNIFIKQIYLNNTLINHSKMTFLHLREKDIIETSNFIDPDTPESRINLNISLQPKNTE